MTMATLAAVSVKATGNLTTWATHIHTGNTSHTKPDETCISRTVLTNNDTTHTARPAGPRRR